MARRPPRSRAQELQAHVNIGTAAEALCRALVFMEPHVHHFDYARRVILDGIAQLEQEQKAAEAPAAEPKTAEPKA
jgi:hypothetical protein